MADRRTHAAPAAVLFLTLAPSAALAQAAEGLGRFAVSSTVLLATDYVSRGQSYTGGKPFILGSLDLVHASGAYAGIYGANVDFGDDESNSEIGLYTGWAGAVGGFAVDANAYYYIYPGVPDEFDYDYWEFGATIGYPVGDFTPTMRANWSPDYFGGRGDEYYLRAGLAWDVPQVPGVNLAVWGSRQFGDSTIPVFYDWGAAISYAIPEVGTVELLWSDSDLPGVGDRLTASIRRTF